MVLFDFRNSKEFTALRCHEKQMLKLTEVIKTALNEVGCEELPSGCDDISVDHSFIENNVNNGNTDQTVSVRTMSNNSNNCEHRNRYSVWATEEPTQGIQYQNC